MARCKDALIPACHDGNVRVETTAEGWSIFILVWGVNAVNARILPSAITRCGPRAEGAHVALLSKRLLFLNIFIGFSAEIVILQ